MSDKVIVNSTSSSVVEVNSRTGGLQSTVELYADLPDPTSLISGHVVTVVDDPITGLNGQHTVLGPVGDFGTHYLKT